MEDRYLNFYHYVMECIDDEDFSAREYEHLNLGEFDEIILDK